LEVFFLAQAQGNSARGGLAQRCGGVAEGQTEAAKGG